MTNDAMRHHLMDAPSMEPQPFCSLPWCGKAPGGPDKTYIVNGRKVAYPAGIDAHHVLGNKVGPVVYLCHECHMDHHSFFPMRFRYIDGWQASDPQHGWEPLIIHDPCRDDSSPESIDYPELSRLLDLSNHLDYLISAEVAKLAYRRDDLAEWLVNERDFKPRSVGAYITKRAMYGSLEGHGVESLGITRGYKVAKLVAEGYDLGELMRDVTTMSGEQFDAQYQEG